MILDNKEFLDLVERNRMEGILLSNGFKNDLNQHKRFSMKISGHKLNVDIGPDYIEMFVNTTLVLHQGEIESPRGIRQGI